MWNDITSRLNRQGKISSRRKQADNAQFGLKDHFNRKQVVKEITCTECDIVNALKDEYEILLENG